MWSNSSTVQVFDSILTFTTHSKPKVILHRDFFLTSMLMHAPSFREREGGVGERIVYISCTFHIR